MVPMVKVRGDDDPLEGLPTPPDVCMKKNAGGDLQDRQDAGCFQGESSGQRKRDRWGNDQPVDRVVTKRRDPVHRLDRMMHRMEPPQERNLVTPPVNPIDQSVHYKEPEDELRCQTKRGDQRRHEHSRQPEQTHDCHHKTSSQRGGCEYRLAERIRKVEADERATKLLFVSRKQLLEWHDE